MAIVKPFRALRPRPELAAKICELPYDVMSSEEARVIAQGNPLSFLHVSKPEIDLPPGTNPYAPEVYARGRSNFQALIHQGALRQDDRPSFYLYRQIMAGHSQTGFVGVASSEDYLRGIVKKHEFTRPDKEDDRVRHIEALNSQTGPVFLVYRDNEALREISIKKSEARPDIDFTAADGVQHTAWLISDGPTVAKIEKLFAAVPALYIADGHHRSAAAARVAQARKSAGGSAFFLSVIFPAAEVRILPYNRVLKDLNGNSSEQLLAKLAVIFEVSEETAVPAEQQELGFYLPGKWRKLKFRSKFTAAADRAETLDVTLLQKHVLEPLFGITDPRTSKGINFVGGIRGPKELEKLVDGGDYACAFSMFPTRIEDLMAIADAGGIMPPKSTWFEPKLRDAMFCHLIG
jgi:uncharacterized protein (DUF1015 family)